MSAHEQQYAGLIDVLQTVPAKNSTANTNARDVIGNKTDDEVGDSLYANNYILLNHIHNVQKVYPTLAVGITVTAAAGAWALSAAYVVVVPTNTITLPFDIHAIHIGDFTANQTYELVLYAGPNSSEVEVGRIRFTRLANNNPGSVVQMMTPIIAANTQIKCKIASSSGGAAATFSIIYHTY